MIKGKVASKMAPDHHSPDFASACSNPLVAASAALRLCAFALKIPPSPVAQFFFGEAIRRWFGLQKNNDFERIEVEAAFQDNDIILVPTALTMRGSGRTRILEKEVCPLSFHRDYQSRLWKTQIAACRRESANDVSWACSQIKRVVADHQNADTKNVHEADLLRTAGALSVLGVDLGLYLMKGYDCPKSQFSFSGLPPYPCPVEIKKRSSRFDYQIMRYTDLPRAVVLCVEHDLKNPPGHVDILELSALADYLKN